MGDVSQNMTTSRSPRKKGRPFFLLGCGPNFEKPVKNKSYSSSDFTYVYQILTALGSTIKKSLQVVYPLKNYASTLV